MDGGRWLRAGRAVGITPAEAVALAILLAGAAALTGVVWWTSQPVALPGASSAAVAGSSPTATAAAGLPDGVVVTPSPDRWATDAATVVVDVIGLVARPGLVELPAGARVDDALRGAGGTLPGADTSTLNRARPLQDGEQLVVGDGTAPPAAAGPDGGPPTLADGRLDLNRATAEDLQTLPGVGPVTAERIVAHREERGGFADVVELLEVPGIGPRRFEDLEALVGT